MLAQAAAGLHSFEGAVVHNDIKEANILVHRVEGSGCVVAKVRYHRGIRGRGH